ncbi:MAG TPA: acyltransferase [Bacteroidota bacterium]|nr:acyltransferase [Bacteroidota bacterium]
MIYYIETGIRRRIWKIRGLLLKAYLRLHGCSVGKSTTCIGWPFFKQIPCSNITVGDGVTIGRGVTIEVGINAKLKIGSYVNISDGVYFGVQDSVTIGDYTGFGERVSIRDSTHMFRKKKPHLLQSSFARPIIIGYDVSIGLGSAVLAGVNIKDGVVLGAGTIITSEENTMPYTFYRGYPIEEIGIRP